MSPSRRSLSDLGNFPLTNILSYLSPAHRLSLALTCRSLYAFIVPRILYTSISFPKFTLPSDDVLALRWFRVVKWGSDPALPIDLRINAADASKALRSLELSEAYLHHVFDYDVVYLTRYLRTLIIHGVDSTPPVPHLPRLLSQLTNVSLTFLRHIRLENCKPGELDGLRDLHPLESFAITPKLNSHRYEVGPHTPVGQLLLRSRESLVEVALTNCIWLFDAFDGSTGPQALLWPNVRRLHTALLRPRRQKEPGTPAPPDSLPWPHFPATSSFSLGTSFSSFFLRPENAEFAKNIRHFRGNWRDVRFICQSGAKLEAVWILEKDFPLRWSPGDTFDKELRTLRLVFSLEPKFFSSGSLKKLSALSRHCANITSLTINVYGPHITLFLMVRTVPFLKYVLLLTQLHIMIYNLEGHNKSDLSHTPRASPSIVENKEKENKVHGMGRGSS